MIPLAKLRKNAENPNEMKDDEFNALCQSLADEGWVSPCTVVPGWDDVDTEFGEEIDPRTIVLPDREPDFYEIVGGHHRFDAATSMAWDEAGCWVLDPVKFNADRRTVNLVKLNLIHGQISPIKFSKVYDRMAQSYNAEVLQTMMGFTGEEAFRKLYKDVRTGLPPELQAALDASQGEVRTIDDLSKVLNKLFAEFGDTLDSNYMVFSWGGRDVFWIRADNPLWAKLTAVRKLVDERHLDMTRVATDALGTWLGMYAAAEDFADAEAEQSVEVI